MLRGGGESAETYDANSVRERIQQWQAQGGGVIVADDAATSAQRPASDTPSSRSDRRLSSRTPSRKDTRRTGRWDPATPKTEGPETPRNRSGSAPARRVLSDGHWRKKRSPPKDDSPSRAVPTAGLKSAPASNSSPRRASKQKEGSDLRRESAEGNTLNDMDVREPSRRMHSRREFGRRRRRTSQDSRNVTGTESLQEAPDVITEHGEPPFNTINHGKQSDRRVSGTRTIRSERREDPVPNLDDLDSVAEGTHKAHQSTKGSVRSKRGSLFSHVLGEPKKMFAAHTPETNVTPRLPTIEQWLDETSDPFVDGENDPLEIIPPLNPSPNKRKITPLEQTSKSNDILPEAGHASRGRHASHGSRRHRKIEELNNDLDGHAFDRASEENSVSDAIKETPPARTTPAADSNLAESPTAGLNRRGANRRGSSPVKTRKKSSNLGGSPHEEKGEENEPKEQSSPRELFENADIGRKRSSGLRPKRNSPYAFENPLSTILSVNTPETEEVDTLPSPFANVPSKTPEPPLSHHGLTSDQRNRPDDKFLRPRNSKTTKHSDLMSILSLPQAGGRSIKSARSIRTDRSRLATASIPDLMRELAADEEKYMRELRTLVDGVIPVLLTCVLSKSDSAVAAGLFHATGSGHEDPTFTKPIVDMGIALERLRTLHKRLPLGDHRRFLTWAHGAQRVYSEYLKAWRLGFQDVVVNLAPASETDPNKTSNVVDKSEVGEDGIPKNAAGDVTNGDGERVDVAFLLKRPLVRLKYLAKSLKGINLLQHSVESESLTLKYQELVELARQRTDEERSRLEDEAAANIDSTRVRDPRTLAPITGVVIDRNRCVRARDHFNLALQHSNGQRLDCRVELVLRDPQKTENNHGDLLICEVDEADRWLLLPPVQANMVSARNGDLQGEIIILIRGAGSSGQEWQETISLHSADEDVGFEWVQMLGLHPVPPAILRSQSFIDKHKRISQIEGGSTQAHTASSNVESPTTKKSTPIPRDIEVPIGEQASDVSKAWKGDSAPTGSAEGWTEASTQGDRHEQPDIANRTPNAPIKSSQTYVDQVNGLRSLPSQNRTPTSRMSEVVQPPRSFKEALGLSGSSNAMGLKRAKAKRLSRLGESSPRSKSSRDGDSPTSSPANSEIQKSSTTTPQGPQTTSPGEQHERLESRQSSSINRQSELERPPLEREPSSLPSRELPYIPKARKATPPATPTSEAEAEPVWSSPPQTQLPGSPKKLSKKRPASPKDGFVAQSLSPKAQNGVSRSSGQLDLSKTPQLEKRSARHRRSSSPLKHEYDPSTASETSSDSDASTVAHHDTASTSESSDEEELEDGDAPTPLIPVGALKSLPKTSMMRYPRPPTDGSIKPSDSASQAPYKTVPVQPTKASRTIASIFSWSDEGAWKSLHPDECSIVITPGLIEAFEMSAAHSHTKPLSSSVPITDSKKFSDMASEITSQNDDVRGERPLVALELTPLVPLRRGTAIDISIRSPPTPSSLITTGNNIMFRSRSPEECEALYALINHSRIHNPTFIALQNARGPYGSGSSFNGPPGRRPGSQAASHRSSWFGGWGRSSSYRASSKRPTSVAQTESSIASMSSAFSALKRFSNRGGGGLFNIAKSTIASRTGSQAGSVCTTSDNSSGSGTVSPLPPGMAESRKEAPIGLNNAKIRLYIRETASKWRDMGSAKLTIMPPERNTMGPDGRPLSSSGAPPPYIIHEKRIVINGKTKGEVLLDEQLGERSFERVARTGIAVSVWEDVVGPNGELGVVNAVGGVAGGRAKVYMIQVSHDHYYCSAIVVLGKSARQLISLQMKTEAETAFTFSLVGKLRY